MKRPYSPPRLERLDASDPRARQMCRGCGHKVNGSLHSCPYNEELHPEDETLCNCCEECQRQCALEV